MEKSIFKKFFIIIFYLFIFTILLENSFNYLDSDFGWHIRVGKEIVSDKNVPQINHYNFTLDQVPWVDHEWLTNSLMYFTYNKLGYITLSIFFAALLLFVLIILNRHVQKNYQGKPRYFFIMIFTYLGVEAMAPHLGVRVQEISVLGLLLLYLIIYNYSSKKNYKKPLGFRMVGKWKFLNHKILLLLPLLFFIWSNLHGGFLLGIAIMFFWLSIKVLELLIVKYNYQDKKYLAFLNFEQKLSSKDLIIFFIAATFSSLATLLTPYGIGLYSFLFGYKDTYYLSHVAEWLPFYTYPFVYQQLLFLGIVFSALAISIYYSLAKNDKQFKIKPWELATILLLFYFALKSKRHFPLFFITSYPFLISFFNKFFPQSNRKTTFVKYHNIINLFLAINLFLFACFFIVNTEFTNFPFKNNHGKYPYKAVNFLKKNHQYDQQKLFNYYSWGGYLIWTYPEKKLFIDGRLPQYPLGGHSSLEEYFEFFKKDQVAKKLKQYNIGLVLLKKHPINYPNFFEKYIIGLNVDDINPKKDQLVTYLQKSTSWQKIYEDDISLIFTQN